MHACAEPIRRGHHNSFFAVHLKKQKLGFSWHIRSRGEPETLRMPPLLHPARLVYHQSMKGVGQDISEAKQIIKKIMTTAVWMDHTMSHMSENGWPPSAAAPLVVNEIGILPR